MEELIIIENIKETLLTQMAKRIFKNRWSKIFLKLCKTGFSTLFIWQRIPKNTRFMRYSI